MRQSLSDLVRNLAAGLRLALFLPVTRLAFRIDLAQLALLLVVSALLDLGVDWVRAGDDGAFSWLGLGNEVFGAGLLLVTAVGLALAFRERSLALSLPVLVLAGFPVLQLARILPSLAGDALPAPDLVGAAFEALLIAWVFALSARAVAIAFVPGPPGRRWRALAGGLALIAPMWFAPSIAPSDAWFAVPSAQGGADPRFPNPASEPVLVAQQHLLDEALADLEDERPQVTDLYFVGFAGDAREDALRTDMLAAQKVMDERWGTDGRSIVLINNPRTLLETPAATVSNLRETLNEIGAAIDVEEDVVMVYLAGGGSRDATLDVWLPPLELAPLTAPVLRGLFDAAGIKWRIVVVSACRSGGFIDALEDDHTMVLTASAADRRPYGCGRRGEATGFGEALFEHGLAHADTLLGAFEAARARVEEREKSAGFAPPSAPQSFVGPAMAEKLKELDRGNAARRRGRSV